MPEKASPVVISTRPCFRPEKGSPSQRTPAFNACTTPSTWFSKSTWSTVASERGACRVLLSVAKPRLTGNKNTKEAQLIDQLRF